MDSGWEVEFAKFLDINGIAWERPSYLTWIDSKNKARKYYPDFFLPALNIYVDTKNKLVMSKQREKIKAIRALYDNVIIATLDELLAMNWPGRGESNPHVSN